MADAHHYAQSIELGGKRKVMVISNIEQIETGWDSIAQVVFVPRTEAEYDRLIDILDGLIDIVREDESHPLASLMDVIGTLIEHYEDENVPELDEA